MNKDQPKPQKKNRRPLTAGAILLALVAVALFMLCGQQDYLLLTDQNSGRALLALAAAEGDGFAVSFDHSVNKSPVTEYYRIEGRQIYLEALRYYAFGAGMPEGPETGQTLFYAADGAMLIGGFHRPLPDLCYIVGFNSAHTLSWQGRDIPLNSLAEPGQPLLFSVVTLNRWQALRLL